MYEIRQCTSAACGLRFPIDPTLHRGAYCPRCGHPLVAIGTPYQTPQDGVETHPKRRISVLVDNLRSAHNVGAIFRTADGVGAEHVYLCGITPNPKDSPALQKTALGAETALAWSSHPDAVILGQTLKQQEHLLVGLETTPRSVPIFNIQPDPLANKTLLLVVGNEQAGVDPGLLALCDLVVALPMQGVKASLNAAVAFGVIAYWLAFI